MSIYDDWPSNLPRETLIRFVRVYSSEIFNAQQRLAALFPDRFPLGDGEVFPASQRVIILEELEDLLGLVEREMKRLREGTTEHE